MIVESKNIQGYLEDFHSGRIAEGKGIGCELDNYLRWKQSQLNIILGHDNTGKTYWRLWYYLNLATKHGLRFGVWSGENKAGQLMRDLIQWKTGSRFKELSIAEVYRHQQELEQYFIFLDNGKSYKANEILNIFKEEGVHGGLIDPYTGLNRGYTHADNYDFLNMSREWTNSTGSTLDVCTHPISESGRSSGVYPQDHEWSGHIKMPMKAQTEGGKPFQNRCDDFICVHRLIKHPTMKYYTMISIEKIKDKETGGQISEFNSPLLFEYNYGLGFKIEGINPLKDKYVEPTEQGNEDFLRNKAIEKAKNDINDEWRQKEDDEEIPF